ncbi:hypothetical protein [Streptomyces orinoci]|uniref:Integral membrane protein n=1 Tax=Streptomyces orinoci TaxID=67339 RepID=A0ABV3K7P4_STRON|nr:hypothetical protein [Streptomyces orinoci]
MPSAVTGEAMPRTARTARAGLPRRALPAAAGAMTGLLLLMALRLPWAGDLGMHAAVLERLRTDLLHPGNPLVNADTPSPYYSPWMVLLALLASLTGWSTFTVLRLAALAGLLLLVTGVRALVRTLSPHRAAFPLALLCLLLLQGVRLFAWSGVPSLTSLALTLAYPSTLALGLTLQLWALTRRAVDESWRTPAFAGLGLLAALILLCHQFTGAVAVLGLLAFLLGRRPLPTPGLWAGIGVALAVALLPLLAWPYYPFFALTGAPGLDGIHQPLYTHLAGKFCLVLPGVAALGARLRRDGRDPLALLFALGLAVFTAGGLSGHWAWGRVLPALLVPAQLALAVETAGAAGHRRRVLGAVTAAALLTGAWAQAGVLTYVLPRRAAAAVRQRVPTVPLWPRPRWAADRVPAGATVLTDDYYALRMLPAYGPYTVAPAYPDVFLPDERRRREATRRYYAPATTRAGRLGVLREYGVRWVLQRAGRPGLPPDDPALRPRAHGPGGMTLLEVVAR